LIVCRTDVTTFELAVGEYSSRPGHRNTCNETREKSYAEQGHAMRERRTRIRFSSICIDHNPRLNTATIANDYLSLFLFIFLA